jgi:small-conductance mechanosensitive channel
MALVLVAAFSGCGGSDDDSGSSAGSPTSSVTTTTSGGGSALDEWATGLCQAVASWKSTVAQTKAKLNASQADFASASQAITSASQALVGSLEGLGTPPAPATTQAKDSIDELSSNLQKESGAIQTALNGTFNTQSEVAQASAQVRSSISKMNADISRTVAELQALPDEGWKQSFRAVPSCQAVVKG